jgi:uncharacterized membrane protein YbaN (DUF454 family)
MGEEDFSHEVRPHDSPFVRHAFLAAGFVCVGLAVLGVLLPVLPATPFVLVAAACFARASPRFYNWVMNHRHFGPTVREWRRYRSIPYRVKLWAIALMASSLGVSIVFFVRPGWLQAALAAFGVLLAVWMYRLPSRDRSR